MAYTKENVGDMHLLISDRRVFMLFIDADDLIDKSLLVGAHEAPLLCPFYSFIIFSLKISCMWLS